MSDITDNIHSVLQNITQNKQQALMAQKASAQAVGQLDDESRKSIDQLLSKFEHPQAIAQFVQAVAQFEGLNKALADMDAAIAVLQIAADDDAFQQQAQAQLAANIVAASSPLLAAGQSSESAASVPASTGNDQTASNSPASN